MIHVHCTNSVQINVVSINMVTETRGKLSSGLLYRKDYFIAPFFAQCLPNHATFELGLLNKIKIRYKKWGGQNIVCPLGVKKWGGHVPPVPHQITPMATPLHWA